MIILIIIKKKKSPICIMKEYVIEKLDYFKKLKEDPKFLGFLVNISSVSYILNTSLL